MQAHTGSAPTPVLRDVSIRGVRVRFLEAGYGPPVILVHGFLASHTAWEEITRPLQARFRVIVPDLPGFGESEKPSPSRYAYTASAFAETLVDLIAALDVHRAAVVGQRMGATIALAMAVTYPDLVERLVLVSPDVYPRRLSSWERLASAPFLGSIVFGQVTSQKLFLRYFDPWTPAALPMSGRMLDWFDAFNEPSAREAAHATLRGLPDTRALLARLLRASAPTLVCGGGRDNLARLTQVRRLARELPRGRLELFDTRSAPEDERPEELARRLEAFLLEAQLPSS